ncbi:hypothetical protein ACGFNV_36245 [Streptomyces sp. NPDC048751]|uniref:hypothetical protein n=1 Tax=Streptomyces sp. NPDC048751 TaxID=3365591 RepID=UPI003715FA81
MSLTPGRRMLFAVICAVAVATIYVAQPVLAQIGGVSGVIIGILACSRAVSLTCGRV